MFVKIIKSFLYALNGLRHAYVHDKSFHLEVWGSLILIAFAFLFWPLKWIELILLVLSFVLILATELINTAFETMLEKIHPEQHELIGATKDIAAAAVLLVVLFTLFLLIMIALKHLNILL